MGTLVTLDIDYTGLINLEGVHYWIFVICLCHIWAYFVLEAIHINRGYSKFAHAKTPPLLGMSVLPLTVFLHSIHNTAYQYNYYAVISLLRLLQTNTYQGILITDGRNSYAVFIYQCDAMGWSGSATIGYYASGDFYENHNLSSTSTANRVACLNTPNTVWSNLVYQLHKGAHDLTNAI